MNDEERKALAEARGRVANLRAMFNKGAVTNTEPPAWKRRAPIKLPTADKPEDSKKTDDVKHLHAVKSSESLVDAAVQERKLREEQERRTAQEARDAMAKQSSYDLESDHAYNHAVMQKEYERSVEQKAKESLSQFTSDGKTFEAEKREEQRRLEEIERKKEQDTKNLHATTTYSTEYDHSYNHHVKQRETTTKAEQDAQNALRNFAGGKTFFEEQLEEKKRLQELERQKEQHAKEASTKNSYSSTDFDHAYVHAKEVAQVEKEAEEKAKAALLQYDQHDVSHEYVMKNGVMVSKHASASGTPKAKRYPFTDPAARVKKPSPQAIKALARFQEQLAESRAREERKAVEEASRKASWESGRKMSIESVESMGSVRKQSFDEVDIEQIKASVDGAKLDVRSAAQKFAAMDRKATELAKQSQKPMTFNGVSYGHSGRVFRTKEQNRKESQRKNDMATRIQSRVRGVMAREAYSERVASAERIAIRIQTGFRRRQAQRQLEDLRQRLQREQQGAVVIQKLVRGRSQRNRYQTEVAVRKTAAVLLQSLVRTRQAQAAYTKQVTAAHEIQEFASRMLAGRKARSEAACLRKERDAATVIQSVYRTKSAKSEAEDRRDAIIRLQCAWRQALARNTVSRLKEEAEVKALNRKQLEQAMATKIQSHWRGTAARSEVATLRAESAEIESAKAAEAEAAAKAAAEAAAAEEAARQEELARQEEASRLEEQARLEEEQARQAEVENSMATKIQSHWRGTAARSEVATLRAESAEIESAKAAEAEAAAKAAAEAAAAEEAARQEELARQEEASRLEEQARLEEEQARQAEVENSMATKIQSHWRGTAARSEVATLRAESAEIESAKAAEAEAAAKAAAEEAARQEELARQEEASRLEEQARLEEEQARQAEVENSMATKIQSHWRGTAARSEVATLRAESAEIESAKAAEAEAAAKAAAEAAAAEEAARQEELARQEEASRLEEQARLEEEQARQAEVENSMATKIQSHWRGTAARSEVATLRAESAEIESAKAAEAEAAAKAAAEAAAAEEAARQEELARQEEASRLEEQARLEEEQARQAEVENSMATKIQSHWRGTAARSEVATLRAESAEIESAKAAEAEAAAKAAAEAAAAEEAARQEELARQEEASRLEEQARLEEEQARQAEVENSMATKIQSHWRGTAARSEVATLRAESAEIESAKAAEAEAAAKAAAEAAAAEEAARQEELARQEEASRLEEQARLEEEQARQAEVENSMATKIQSHWRGTAARSEVATLRAESAEIESAKAAEAEAAAKAAAEAAAAEEAARQEELARQEEASRLEEQARLEEEQARQAEVENSMATKIQSHWRGTAARSEVATLRAESAEIESAKAAEAEAAAKAAAEAAAAEEAARQEELARQEEASRLEEQARLEEEQARQAEVENSMATKIQSHWRGTAARSEVATLRAESAEIESAKAAEAEAAAKAAAEAAAAEEAARQEELARQEEASRLEEQARLEEEQARQAEVENSMATKIQSHWRGTAARSEVAVLRSEAIVSVQAQLARIENMTAVQIQSTWRGALARRKVSVIRAERTLERENFMAVRLQSQWRSVMASRKVNELRGQQRASAVAQAELENAMALKIQCRWRIIIAERKLAKHRQAAQQAVETKNATLIQAAWRGRVGRKEAELLRSSEKEASGLEKPRMRRQPTLAEIQLLCQTGRFSNLSDDSDDDSEFEDVSNFVDAPLAPTPASLQLIDSETESVPASLVAANAQIQSPLAYEGSTPRASSSSVNMGLEFSIPEDHSTIPDDKSDASSDSFVDAMEEHKPIGHGLDNAGVEENRHWANDNNNSPFDTLSSETPVPVSDAVPSSPAKEETLEFDNERPSSISDFDRPSSVRSGSFFQEPSFDSDTPRGSLASSSLSGTHDEPLADPFRSRGDSYADSPRSRGDSYADSIRSRNDSYADVFRSRNNSYDDVFRSRGDSYADVPSKTDFDEHNLSDEETHNTPKEFDTDSERASSTISDSPVSGQNNVEVEKNEGHEEEQESRKKSGSRWRASSVLSALSSRRSSKPTSSPTSSLEDEEKDIDQKKNRSSTLPAVAASGLSSVAGMLNRKLSIPASNNSTTKSFEEDIEESFVYSPPAQQATKSKSRFGRFTAPTVSKPAFPTRFAWKSRGRRSTNDGEDDEHAGTHAA